MPEDYIKSIARIHRPELPHLPPINNKKCLPPSKGQAFLDAK
jgi:hypothetical protein